MKLIPGPVRRRLIAAAILGFAGLLAQAAPSRLDEAQARHLLDAAQNLVFTTDFRQLYAAVARDWWGVNPETVVRGRFEPLRFLKT